MTRNRIISIIGGLFTAAIIMQNLKSCPAPDSSVETPAEQTVQTISPPDTRQEEKTEEKEPPPEEPKDKSKPKPNPRPKPKPKDDERSVQMRRPEVATNVATTKEIFALAKKLAPKMTDSGDAIGSKFMSCAKKTHGRYEHFTLLQSNEDGICWRFQDMSSGFLCVMDKPSGKPYAETTDDELLTMNKQLGEFLYVLRACEGSVQ